MTAIATITSAAAAADVKPAVAAFGAAQRTRAAKNFVELISKRSAIAAVHRVSTTATAVCTAGRTSRLVGSTTAATISAANATTNAATVVTATAATSISGAVAALARTATAAGASRAASAHRTATAAAGRNVASKTRRAARTAVRRHTLTSDTASTASDRHIRAGRNRQFLNFYETARAAASGTIAAVLTATATTNGKNEKLLPPCLGSRPRTTLGDFLDDHIGASVFNDPPQFGKTNFI